MATLKDFESDKKEILSIIDSLNKICNLDTNDFLESDIKFKLFNLHKKVKQTNSTLDNILNEMSNIQQKSLARLKDSLQELIIKLERSVCVPEFCINSEIHSSCQYLTKKLIEHLQEITFCYDLSDMPRATNKGVPKKEKFRTNSLYKSVAPSESELIESEMRKKSIKCKRRQAKNHSRTIKENTLNTLNSKTIGRFTLSYPGVSMANSGVGKKKQRKGAGSRKQRQTLKKKPEKKEKKKKSRRNKNKY